MALICSVFALRGSLENPIIDTSIKIIQSVFTFQFINRFTNNEQLITSLEIKNKTSENCGSKRMLFYFRQSDTLKSPFGTVSSMRLATHTWAHGRREGQRTEHTHNLIFITTTWFATIGSIAVHTIMLQFTIFVAISSHWFSLIKLLFWTLLLLPLLLLKRFFFYIHRWEFD